MRLLEELLWYLTEIIDESNCGVLFQRVINAIKMIMVKLSQIGIYILYLLVNINVALVEEMMKHIDGIHG